MTTETRSETRTNNGKPGAIPSGRWRIVPQESHVGFRVRKMGLYHVKGRFREIDGTVEFAPAGASAAVEIDPSSITTRMPPRDLHLRSSQFLDVKRHPRIVISADRGLVAGAPAITVPAVFEIRGQRHEVELAGHFVQGSDRAPVLHLQGALDRHDFGIRPPQPFEMIVGRRVELDVELVLAAAGDEEPGADIR